MIVNLNGTFVDANTHQVFINDGALLHGDSLFETLKAKDVHLCFCREHLDRLQLSAGLIEFPFDRAAAANALRLTAERLPWPVARLRLTISRGPVPPQQNHPPQSGWFAITAVECKEPTNEERRRGVACCIAPNQRVNPLSHLPQMKRGNYADCLYATRHARSQNCREALFIDPDGNLLEGATSNLFVLRGNELLTPPTGELVLAGVMRRVVIQCAQQMGLSVQEKSISASSLENADGVFLTNSLIDLLPVGIFEGHRLSVSSLISRLHEVVRSLETSNCNFHEGKS